MAIHFNSDALSRFSNVDFGADDAIANLGENNSLVQNGNRGLGVFAKVRFTSTKDRNNAVRTEFLKALGRAFNLGGVNEVEGGKTTFTDEFMNRLEEILGPAAFKRGDFGIGADGVVNSGKPLTQRRIQAVCNAATDYAARARLDKKFEDVSTLLGGGTISAIIGDDRDEGWSLKLNNFAELAAKVHHAALSLMDEGDSKTINHEGVKIELTVSGGAIRANLTIGGETRPVAGFAATNDVLCTRMLDTINDLYDSFPEQRHGNLTYGRDAISNGVLGTYMELTPEEDLDTKNTCLLRDFAGGLLIKKAGATEAEVGKLTNREILAFARELCKTDNALDVKNAIASNQTFKDVSSLLGGKTIGEIIGDDRTEGWEARVDNLAVMTAKLQLAARGVDLDGDSATVELGALKVDLKLTDGKIAATVTVGVSKRKLSAPQADFRKRIDDAAVSTHNSFDGKVLAHYKVLSEKEDKNYLETKVRCPLRDYASWLLKTKARVTDEQIAELTNKQLVEFVGVYFQAGDGSGIKDLVDATIEENIKNKVEVEPQPKPPANDGKFININEI